MATSAACGSSQARCWIEAAAEAYVTATTTPNLSCIPYLHCSLQQHWIQNPLSEARWVLNLLSYNGNSCFCFVISYWLVLFFRLHIQVITYRVCLCLIYFTKHNTLQVHSCCCKWQIFIRFYGWVVVHLYTHTHTHTHTPHTHTRHFFIHSSVVRHLHSFHILVIPNNAAMNIGVHISFRTSVFLFWSLLGPHLRHMDVFRLGVELELQLLA